MSSRAFISNEERPTSKRRRRTKRTIYVCTGWHPPGPLRLVTDDGKKLDIRGLDIEAEEMFRRVVEAGIPLEAGLLDSGFSPGALPLGMHLHGEEGDWVEEAAETDEWRDRPLNDNDPLVRIRPRVHKMEQLAREDPFFGFEPIPTFA